MLEDTLLPNEVIVYRQDLPGVQVGAHVYDHLAITNNRIIFYKREGLIFKKDNVTTIGLSKLTAVQFNEKGLVSKKGILKLHLKDEQDIDVIGPLSSIKYLYQHLASKIN
jgi:hypothetical protein